VRVICLLVPLFPLAARLRSEPELAGEKAVILSGNGSGARVIAATRPARRAGLKAGMTLAQARALTPRVLVRSRDFESERAAQQAMLEVGESFSPRVEDADEGVAYLDATGLDAHFPGESPERDLMSAAMLRGERLGLPLWAGAASSKLAARVAAELPDSPVVVPPGDEADFLAPLPLSRLSPETDAALTLERWGLRSIGDLARLSKDEITSRLGEAGRLLHQSARGLDPRPLTPREPPPSFREGLELEWPLIQLEPFLFIARSALERLCRRLEAHGLACAQLDVSLKLEPEGYHERSVRLPAPTREVRTLLTVVRLDLESAPPGAPVVGFRLTAHPDTPRQAQLSLFGPTTLAPDRLATTLARLFALLGEERVGSPGATDGHRPERLSVVEYRPPPPPKVAHESPRSRGLMAVRVLRPPLEIEVLVVDDHPGNRPTHLRTLPQEGADRRLRLDSAVRVASGPWALEEQWWAEQPVDRSYWDIELETGGIFRVFQNNRTGNWYADGVYD
jgi:protein ImuB